MSQIVSSLRASPENPFDWNFLKVSLVVEDVLNVQECLAHPEL